MFGRECAQTLCKAHSNPLFEEEKAGCGMIHCANHTTPQPSQARGGPKNRLEVYTQLFALYLSWCYTGIS